MGDWQEIVSLGIVALSAALLVRNQFQKRKQAQLNSCDSECGCAGSAPPAKKSLSPRTEKNLNNCIIKKCTAASSPKVNGNASNQKERVVHTPFVFNVQEEAMVCQHGCAPKHLKGAHYEFCPLHSFSHVRTPLCTSLVFPNSFIADIRGNVYFRTILDECTGSQRLRHRSVSK